MRTIFCMKQTVWSEYWRWSPLTRYTCICRETRAIRISSTTSISPRLYHFLRYEKTWEAWLLSYIWQGWQMPSTDKFIRNHLSLQRGQSSMASWPSACLKSSNTLRPSYHSKLVALGQGSQEPTDMDVVDGTISPSDAVISSNSIILTMPSGGFWSLHVLAHHGEDT